MPLSSSPSGSNDHRGQRWTIAILALALLAACAVGMGVHTLVEAGRPAEARQVAAVEGPSQQAAASGRASGTRGCPKGAVPRVEIEDLQVRPALKDGLWLHPGRNRITVRGDLINDTSAPIAVRAVPFTVDGSRWRAHTRYAKGVGAYSSEPVVAHGVLVSTGRERMALAARLSWGWRDRGVRPCGRSGLSEDD